LNYFVGSHIKPECIKACDCKIGSSKIEGQCLHNMALKVAKKYKLAKSFAKEFLVIKGNIKDGNFDLPSGTTANDVLKFVLDKMFELEVSQKKKTKSEVTQVSVVSNPVTYFSMAFLLLFCLDPSCLASVIVWLFWKKTILGNKQMDITCHHIMLPANWLMKKLTQALLTNKSRKRNNNQVLVI